MESAPRIILDTSLFVNPSTQKHFGTNTDTAVEGIVNTSDEHGISLYMPRSVYREMANFVSEEALMLFRRYATVRGPDLYNQQVPAALFHTFIGDLRQRVNKGLAVAEKAIRSEDRPENIRWVRQRYREAMRSGIVDSVEDFEVVLLAKEVGGVILSADEGIANMAEDLGIEVLSAKEFLNRHVSKKASPTHDR